MFLAVIKYLLKTAFEDNKYPLPNDHGILATLLQIFGLCEELPILFRNLSEGCQYPLAPFSKFVRGLKIPSDIILNKLSEDWQNFLRHLPEGCPINMPRGNLSAISQKNVLESFINCQRLMS
jgi:hypothetical protein